MFDYWSKIISDGQGGLYESLTLFPVSHLLCQVAHRWTQVNLKQLLYKEKNLHELKLLNEAIHGTNRSTYNSENCVRPTTVLVHVGFPNVSSFWEKDEKRQSTPCHVWGIVIKCLRKGFSYIRCHFKLCQSFDAMNTSYLHTLLWTMSVYYS